MLISNAVLLAVMFGVAGVGLIATAIAGALMQDWLEARAQRARRTA